MPAYVAGNARSIYPGDVVILSNTALSDPYATSAVAVGPNSDGSPIKLTVVNPSSETAVVQFATADTNSSYEPLTAGDEGEAITIAATSSVAFTSGVGFIRVVFAGSPSTSVVTLSR